MKEEIKKFFAGDVEDSDEVLTKYSHDASLFEVRPKLVVFPKNEKDIENLVQWVNDNKAKYPDLSLTARAAGTCMSGGPLNESIIMDFTKYMNKIKKIERVIPFTIQPLFPGAKPVTVVGKAVVEPGCFYRDFEIEADKLNLLLPCYTASKSINAVGGMVGNNSGGELTLRYGKTEDYVASLRTVFSDGHTYTVGPENRRELYSKIAQVDIEGQIHKKVFDLIENNQALIDAARPNVSKNSAGYYLWNVLKKNTNEQENIFDLTKLLVGSQGTLGINTEITFYLVEKPSASKLAVVFLDKLDNLGEIVDTILETNPESVESYDNKTFMLAVRFFMDFIKTKGLFGTIKFGLSFLPELWLVLTGGVPKLILLIEYTGSTEEELDVKCRNVLNKLTPFKLRGRVTKSIQEAEKYWTIRRDSFALLRKHVKGRRTAPFIDDIIVRPEHLPEFLPKLNTLLNQYPTITYTIAGHAGNGNFHIIPLMDFNDPKTKPVILELSEKVYELVLLYHGSIDAEHNDGLIRTPFLKKMYGKEVYALFEVVKNTFDPKGIFNPHKKVFEDKNYLETHIIDPKQPITQHSS